MSVSETAKQLFQGLGAAKEAAIAMAPGLQNFVPQIGAELSRLGTQGSMEIASMLFNGQAYVPYGPGAYTQEAEQQTTKEPEPTHEQQRGGIER